jgi:ribose/xylose/arabinose/galactoside ABC-type transport system permease subunit
VRTWRGISPLARGAGALALLAVVGATLHPGFLSARVALDLLSDNAVLGLATLGASCVMIAGGLDLSVGSLAALASVVLALLLERAGAPPWAAVATVLAMGALLGLSQGALVDALALPPFLVTLSGMFLFRGLALSLAAESIGIAGGKWSALASSSLPLVGGLRLRVGGAVFAAAALALGAFAVRSRLFSRLHALGGDERAARLLGIPVRRTKLAVYALSGAFSALAGVVFALTSASGSSVAGSGLELDAIAAAVVGGVALGPGGGVFRGRGRGGISGACLGVLVFGVIADLILFQGTLSAGWTRVAMGGMLLLFLSLERVLVRRERTA